MTYKSKADPREYTVEFTDYSDPRNPLPGGFTVVAQSLESALRKAVTLAPNGATITLVGEKRGNP